MDDDLLTTAEVAAIAECRPAWVTYWAEKGVLRHRWSTGRYHERETASANHAQRHRVFMVRWARAFKLDQRAGNLTRGTLWEIRQRQKTIAKLYASAGKEKGEELLQRWIKHKWISKGPIFMSALAMAEDRERRNPSRPIRRMRLQEG